MLLFESQNGTGSVDWGGSTPVVDGGAASDGTCVAVLSDQGPAACTDPDNAPDFSIHFDCEKLDQPNAGFAVDAGNVLELAPGDHQLVPTEVYPLPNGSPTLTLRLESKTGSAAGYPEPPTPDFDAGLPVEHAHGVAALRDQGESVQPRARDVPAMCVLKARQAAFTLRCEAPGSSRRRAGGRKRGLSGYALIAWLPSFSPQVAQLLGTWAL